jgi:fermentation-respiration switch protein FrsA (DUF1100 family)
MKNPFIKIAGSLLIGMAAIYFALIVILFVMQRSLIYVPDQSPLGIPSVEGASVTNAAITTQDKNKLNGWFLKASAKPENVVILFHGNASNISGRINKALDFVHAGYGVLLAEYRGYGNNMGEPSEDGLYQDGRAYMRWLGANGYAPDHVIIYGESLGTGVAVQIAKETPPKALILEVPFSRLSEPAQKRYWFIPFIDLLMFDKYDSYSKIGDILVPTLFLIAGKDETLGPETGLKLYEKANDPKILKIFENGGHNNLRELGAPKVVLEFLEGLK